MSDGERFVVRDLRTHFCDTLLTRFYDDLMIVNFPIAEELDDIETFRLSLHPKLVAQADSRFPELHILIAINEKTKETQNCRLHQISVDRDSDQATKWIYGSGDGASDYFIDQKEEKGPCTCVIVGAIVFEYYSNENFALVSYMAVSKEYRKKGVISHLHTEALKIIDQRAKSLNNSDKPTAVFAETNRPTVDDGIMDPTLRHSILQKLGYGHILTCYIQPPLDVDGEPCYDLLLLAHRNYLSSASHTILSNHVENYILGFCRSVFGYDDELFQDQNFFRESTKELIKDKQVAVNIALPWVEVEKSVFSS